MPIKFDLYRVVGPDWESTSPERLQALEDAVRGVWHTDPQRNREIGFTEFHHVADGVFGGYFVVSAALSFLRYDDPARPPTSGRLREHERMLTAVLVPEGVWAIQDKRFPRTDLSKGEVRSLFQGAVAVALFNAGLYQEGQLEPLETEEPSADILAAYKNADGRVVSVKVTSLSGRSVPTSFKFFNPREDDDQLVHAFFDANLESVESAEFQASAEHDVRTSKIADALAHTGEIVQYETIVDGTRRPTARRVPRTITLDIDPESSDVAVDDIFALVAAHVRGGGVFGPDAGRRSTTVGTLWEGVDV